MPKSQSSSTLTNEEIDEELANEAISVSRWQRKGKKRRLVSVSPSAPIKISNKKTFPKRIYKTRLFKPKVEILKYDNQHHSPGSLNKSKKPILMQQSVLEQDSSGNESKMDETSLEQRKSPGRIEELKEDSHGEDHSQSVKSHTIIKSEAPSSSDKRIVTTQNRLKLPRKVVVASSPKAQSQEATSTRHFIFFGNDSDDNKEEIKPTFSLPQCINDNAPSLPLPERSKKKIQNPYYAMKGENPDSALRRIIIDHEKWKALYIEEMKKRDPNGPFKDFISLGKEVQNFFPESSRFDEKIDPYIFKPPVQASGVPYIRETDYLTSCSRGAEYISFGASNMYNRPHRHVLKKKTLREPDFDEMAAAHQQEEQKRIEWMNQNRPKSKRNRKQSSSQGKSTPIEEGVDVQFDFNQTWDGQTFNWQSQQMSSSVSPQFQTFPRKALFDNPVIKEEKVECPICQRSFPISKIEAHASNCFDSPMDVE